MKREITLLKAMLPVIQLTAARIKELFRPRQVVSTVLCAAATGAYVTVRKNCGSIIGKQEIAVRRRLHVRQLPSGALRP